MSDTTYENVGGAWERVDRTGGTFLSVKLDQPVEAGARLLIFRNKYKLNAMDKRPDFIVVMPVDVPEEKTPDPF